MEEPYFRLEFMEKGSGGIESVFGPYSALFDPKIVYPPFLWRDCLDHFQLCFRGYLISYQSISVARPSVP